MTAKTDPVPVLSDDELDVQLRAVEERRQTRLAELEKARQRRHLEEELKLGQLEEEHGPVGVNIAAIFSPADGSMAVVGRPKTIVYETFVRRQMSQKGADVQDVSNIVYSCLLYPSKAAFEGMCDQVPDLRFQAANAIVELGGAGAKDTRGK